MVRVRRRLPRATPVAVRCLRYFIRDDGALRGGVAASEQTIQTQSRGAERLFRATHFLRARVAPGSRNFACTAGAPARYSAAMVDRRSVLLLGCAALAALDPRFAAATGMSRVTAYAFTFKALDGGEILLSSFAGHPVLVVNTASQCGYTPQYAGLQELWTRYRERGLLVLGVPSNDFGGQEPGGANEIHTTAQGQYHVTFPITDKVAEQGSHAH